MLNKEKEDAGIMATSISMAGAPTFDSSSRARYDEREDGMAALLSIYGSLAASRRAIHLVAFCGVG